MASELEENGLDKTRPFRVLTRGTVISHYRIVEKIGSGGMGVVYKAQDTRLDRTVALKFLPSQLVCDAEAKARFEHEAKAASALNHTNITTIHDIDEVEGQCFICMEYVEGKSIKELTRERTLSVNEVLDIAIQICEGLSIAHEKGIVHRDIKSDNIMLAPRGQVKIMDFGLAKLKGVTKLTKTGTTLGTMQYMSPEQAQGMEVDHRSDIFSFGVVLYEMITGQLPFTAEHEAAVIYSIVNETPEPLARYKANVPEALQRIVDKTLQKDRSTRYQSAADIIADLKGLEKETAGVGVEATLPKRLQRFKPLVWGIGLLIVVGIAVSGVLVLKPWLVSKEAEAKSLAVLSFENLGTEADAYLASGLAEDLAIKLRKLAGFRVASSEDIRRLSTEELLPKQMASRLKVQFALGGSLLKADEWIRVNVEVIEQASGEVIWSEQFRRKFTNIHEFHDEVSRKIAKALKVRLSPAEQIALKERPTDSPEAYDHYLKGRYFYYRVTVRDNELAVKQFQKALQLDPNYPLALAGLADAYVQRYKERYDYDEYWLDSSKVLIDRALALDPDLAEAYESRAEVLKEERNTTGAIEAARRARDLRPDWDEPYVHLGDIYNQRGERTKAMAMFDTAISIRPSVDAVCGKGEILQTRGQTDSARAAYQEAIRLNPDHDRPYLELGRLHQKLNESEEAKKYYEQAIEVRPDHAVNYEYLSHWMSSQGRIQEAEDLLRSFVERFPYNWDGYEALYDYLAFWRGNYPAAVKIVEEAVSRNPERTWPHLLLASSYASGMPPETGSDSVVPASERAANAVDRALALRPNSGSVLWWAGSVYGNLGRHDEAMDYFNRALEVMPGYSPLLLRIAQRFMTRRQYEKAAEFGRLAVKHSPGIPQYYFWLRKSLVRLDREQEYLDIIQKATTDYGHDDPTFFRYLGAELCVTGRYKDAIKACERALEIKSDDHTLCQLGIALWLSGDTEGALARFKEGTLWVNGQWIIDILKSEGRFDEIETYLESLKEKTPDRLSGIDVWAWTAGGYYTSMRRFDDAIAVYAELLESGEETYATELTVRMAECYQLKEEIDSARHIMENLAETASGFHRSWILCLLAELEAIGAQDLNAALKLGEKGQAKVNVPNDLVNEPVLRLQYASGKMDDAANTLEQLGTLWWYFNSSCHYRKAQLAGATGSSRAGAYLDNAVAALTRSTRGEDLGSLTDLGAASAFLALALARAGRPGEARQQVKRASKLEPERADMAYHAACAHSLIGDTALALQWLETAVERGYQELWWARVDPDLDPLRKLPRFQEIMTDWDGRLQALFD